jgi:hypothetical protein
MRRSLLIAVLLFVVGVAPLGAQLAITSRVTAEQTTNLKSGPPVPDLLPLILLGVEARYTKLSVDVRTYVGADGVRVEGMGPLLGYAAGMVFISRPDGTALWFDPDARTYFPSHLLGALPVTALSLSPVIKNKADGEETLIGYRATRVQTEIAIKLPEDPDSYRTIHHDLLGDVPVPDTDRVGGGATAGGIPLTMEMWLRTGSLLRDLKITVRNWETKDFGADGVAAANAGALATMSRTFGLAQTGLPLRQIVQTSSSNGRGYRWETTVLSVTRESQPADRFVVPDGYRQVKPPPMNLYPK